MSDDMEKALEARKLVAVTPLPLGPEHLDEEFRAGYKAHAARSGWSFESLEDISKAIWIWQYDNKKSAREFSRLAELSPSTITRLKDGKDISGHAVFRIIKALNSPHPQDVKGGG